MTETTYYKITNKDEKHNGFQYQDGLNVLDGEFAEEGLCVKGGLYFTNLEGISCFYNYGVWIREIRLPVGKKGFKMVKNPSDPAYDELVGEQWRANMVELGAKYPLYAVETFEKFNLGMNYEYMVGAVKHGDLRLLDHLYSNYEDLFAGVFRNEVMIEAIETQNLEKVMYLHQHYKKQRCNARLAVMQVACEGKMKFEFTPYMLYRAMEGGSYDVVEYLVENGARLREDGHNIILSHVPNMSDMVLKLFEKHYDKLEVFENDQAYLKCMEERRSQEVHTCVSLMSIVGVAASLFSLCSAILL